MAHHYSVLIREVHLDSYGHMNNAAYLELFEEARWDLVTPRGFGLNDVKKLGHGPVILEINLKFLKEIHLREKITIVTEFLSQSKKISQVKQKMVKTDGTVASEAIITFGLFDLSTRKLIEPTAAWIAAIKD
jgi:thioesterase III